MKALAELYGVEEDLSKIARYKALLNNRNVFISAYNIISISLTHTRPNMYNMHCNIQFVFSSLKENCIFKVVFQ